MKIFIFILRSALGLFLLAYGIDYFYHLKFLPPIPISSRTANDFLVMISRSGYLFETVYGIEIACGVFLLINRFAPLFLIILLPITVNILLFYYFYDLDNIELPGAILFVNLLLMLLYRRAYRFLFISKGRFVSFNLFVNFKG